MRATVPSRYARACARAGVVKKALKGRTSGLPRKSACAKANGGGKEVGAGVVVTPTPYLRWLEIPDDSVVSAGVHELLVRHFQNTNSV